MEQIEITDEALPILKSGIALKEKLLTVKAENYFKRLKNFEKKHKMKSVKQATVNCEPWNREPE